MFAKILILIFAAAVQGNAIGEINGSALSRLQKMTQTEKEFIVQAETNIYNLPGVMGEMVKGRLQCLSGEYLAQRNSVNETTKEAVFKGMLKNKQFPSFQCISKAGRETFVKLDDVKSKIPENVQKIQNKNLEEVNSYVTVLKGLMAYIQDMYEKKREEIVTSGKEDQIKKILQEVENKMKMSRGIVEQIVEKTRIFKFKFFEEAVDYFHATERSYRNIARDGSGKIMFCVF